MNIPIGLESKNLGIVDLLSEKAIYFDEPQGLTLRIEEIPKDMVSEAKDRRAEMIGKFLLHFSFNLNCVWLSLFVLMQLLHY